jgi:hypothetical protein
MNNNVIIDGLNAFKSIFSSEDALIEHIIEHTLFFDKNMVFEQARLVRIGIRTGEAIPVRYNSNGAFFLQHTVKTTTPSFKNRSEAIAFTNKEENHLFHRETKINICFDRDGNYAPKRAIQNYTGHQVSSGQNSTITNYIIAHIWDKTDNPLYFSLLWNYVLIPCHCAFLTDKRDDSDLFVKRVKELIKAISIELYNPNRIMDWNQDVITSGDMPSKEAIKHAQNLIKEGKINFLSKRQ